MKSLAELDHLNLDPSAKSQVMVLVQALLDQATQDAAVQLQAKDAEIKRKDFKIEALTFELAQIKRLRYGVKSEALSPLQRDVFEDTLNRIWLPSKPNLNNWPPRNRVPPSPNPNAHAPVVNRYRIIYRVLSTVMSLSPAPAGNVAKT